MKLKSKFLSSLLITLLLFMFIFIEAYSYSETISTSLKDNILRLHIIGNSNSMQDQLFKLKCRDKIINYLKENIDYSTSTKKEIISFISDNITNLYTICYNLAKTENISTNFNIYLDTSYFPTKQYSNILMPEGTYDCLKIEIGSSSGNNWWCSLYPPLCFTECATNISTEENINNINSLKSSNLSHEETLLLTNSNSKKDIQIKFKILEVFSSKFND